jgi:hypothetical protein
VCTWRARTWQPMKKQMMFGPSQDGRTLMKSAVMTKPL